MTEHQIDRKIIKETIKLPDPNSHKGENGRILIIGGSPLFHGASRLSAESAYEVILSFASKLADMVYLCSTKENLEIFKNRLETFIGITREQLDNYLPLSDVVLSGPGMMRVEEPGRSETRNEPRITLELTKKVLKSDKRLVLDAGSLQVIKAGDLQNKKHVIITPHRREMSKLFNIDEKDLITSHKDSYNKIESVAKRVQEKAQALKVTILLKGPIDIVASPSGWFYIRGGNAGMTKGGTGDVLAGVVAALYSRVDDPLLAASIGSFIVKKTAEKLWEKHLFLYDAKDLVEELRDVLVENIRK